MKLNLENTYWSDAGSHQAMLEKLNVLVPDEGSVVNADENPALEIFRIASNCYYDLYNNGLCNLADEFRDTFGFGPKEEDDRVLDPDRCWGECCREEPFDAGTAYFESLDNAEVQKIERRMTKIIVAAAKEQGVTL